ncbi:MAG: helical backbone metal receptor, partial [Thermoanaerobaculia bacterium]
AYWIWKDPWMTVSDDTYVADLLRLAGGLNVFARENERYPSIDPGEALARGAEVHFFPSEPFPFRAPRHETMTAEIFGSGSRRLFVEGDDYCWHGARTLDGLAAMRRLRAELFPP